MEPCKDVKEESFGVVLDRKSHDASPYFVITVTNGRERKRTRSFFERGQRSWEIVSKAVRLAQRAKSPLRSNISPFLCKYKQNNIDSV